MVVFADYYQAVVTTGSEGMASGWGVIFAVYVEDPFERSLLMIVERSL